MTAGLRKRIAALSAVDDLVSFASLMSLLIEGASVTSSCVTQSASLADVDAWDGFMLLFEPSIKRIA